MRLRNNFLYNILLSLSNYVFPIITYPYISRTLGVANIGICGFIDSIINYTLIFSSLGIATYGIRQIAKFRDDTNSLNDSFSNLFFINLILTILSITILIILCFTVPEISKDRDFILVGILKIVFNLFLIEWFFQGIEDFKFITLANLFARIIYVILIFIFIRDSNDTIIYYILITLSVAINSILNWNRLNKYIKISFINLNLRLYLVPVLSYGLYRILTSLYTTFNITYLGFVCGTKEVGYFTTATKMFSIILGIFTALTITMVPRISSLLSKGKLEEVRTNNHLSFELLFTFTMPIIAFSEVFAPNIIWLLAGPGFEGAILPFRIVMVLLIIIGLEQVFVQQNLLAIGNNRIILTNSVIGAISGILLNILLVHKYQSIGSAVAWGLAELTVLITAGLHIKQYIGISIPYKLIRKSIYNLSVYLLINIITYFLINNKLFAMAVAALFSILYFCLISKNVISSIFRSLKQ